jgi:FKBP-type peptidyl-prolyl cis-trans isomerase
VKKSIYLSSGPLTAAYVLIAASSWAAAQTPTSTTTAAPSAAAPPAAPAPPPAPAPLTSEEASYLIGVSQAENLHRMGIADSLSADALARGTKDGLAGKKPTPADGQRLQAYVRSVMQETSNRNKAAAQEFLTRNGKEKGVKTTASGLQYKVITAGDAQAAAPKPEDQVSVQYRGKLLDNTEFDSSYTRGSPATFPVNGVIKGWQEALVLMKPGAKWQLFVPPALAYGDQPRPGIPGGSLLVFDVELLSIKPKPPVPQSSPFAPPSPPPANQTKSP